MSLTNIYLIAVVAAAAIYFLFLFLTRTTKDTKAEVRKVALDAEQLKMLLLHRVRGESLDFVGYILHPYDVGYYGFISDGWLYFVPVHELLEKLKDNASQYIINTFVKAYLTSTGKIAMPHLEKECISVNCIGEDIISFN